MAESGYARSLDFPHRVCEARPRPESVAQEQSRHLRFVNKFDSDWTWREESEPDEEVAEELLAYIQRHYDLGLDRDLQVDFLGRGAYNFAFYLFKPSPPHGNHQSAGSATGSSVCEADSGRLPSKLVLRISPSADPYYKTESEVATMTFARLKAGLPVPRVFFFDSSGDNPAGLEWLIMEYVDASTMEDVTEYGDSWTTVGNPVVEPLSRDVAGCCSRLKDAARFDAIGSLYCDWSTRQFFVGPTTEKSFTKGYRAQRTEVPRGPFRDLQSYFNAHLEHWKQEALDFARVPNEAFLFPCEEEMRLSEEQRARRRQDIFDLASRIQEDLIPPFLARLRAMNAAAGLTGPVDGFTTTMQHCDLHGGNIFVTTGSRAVSAIIDWESTNIAPLGMLPHIPAVGRLFGFDEDDMIDCPNCFKNEAGNPLSMKELLAGKWNPINEVWNRCGIIFKPDEECWLPQSMALERLDMTIGAMKHHRPRHVAWFLDAISHLSKPGGGEDESIPLSGRKNRNSKQRQLARHESGELEPEETILNDLEQVGDDTSRAHMPTRSRPPAMPATPALPGRIMLERENMEDIPLSPMAGPPAANGDHGPVEIPLRVLVQEYQAGYFVAHRRGEDAEENLENRQSSSGGGGGGAGWNSWLPPFLFCCF